MPSYKWDNSRLPKVEGKAGVNAGLGDKIEQAFIRFAQRTFLWCVDFISDRLVDIFDQSMKILQPGMNRMMSPVMNNLLNNPGIPDDVKASIRAVQNETGESAFIAKFAVWIYTIRASIFGGLGPVQRFAEYNADRSMRSFLPDPNTTAFAHLIGLMSKEGFTNTMQQHGLHDNLMPMYLELARKLPNAGEVIAGRWRGKISDQEFRDFFKRQGFDEKAAELYLELSNQIPPLSDLLLMMRREAFSDEISSKYGYEEEYPRDIEQYFKMNGYDPKFAKLYYRSGWTVPSPTQGYEMLHRGLIDRNTLNDLLKIADYPPFWRDKLMAMSYSNFTRVDIRRMYQVGVLDEAGVLQAYKDIGYNDEKAQKLTDFTMTMVTQEEKDLTKTDVLNLYEEGLIDRGETASNLVKMGYDSDEAENILKLSDVSIAKAARTDLINYTKEKFIAKQIDENQARSELTEAGLKSRSVERYIMNWQRSSEIEAAIPSIADVKRWYLFDYIDEQELRSYLSLLRHTEKNISLYVEELNDKKAEVEAEETETGTTTAVREIAEGEGSRGGSGRGGSDARVSRSKLPSQSDLERWFVHGNIDEQTFRRYLSAYGYIDLFIDIYVKEAQDEQRKLLTKERRV